MFSNLNEVKPAVANSVEPSGISQPRPLAYAINDFCAVMGVGRTSVYSLLKARKLTAIKIAGRTLIPATEAQRLIQEAMQ